MAAGGYGYALTANALTEAGIDGVPRFLRRARRGGRGIRRARSAARPRRAPGSSGPYLAGVTLALVIALPAVTAVFSGVLRRRSGPPDRRSTACRRCSSTLIAVEQWQAWVAILVAGPS